MNDEIRKKIALFRYGIIAPVVSGTYDEGKSLQGFFRDASGKVYTNPSGEETKISASTLERWYYTYNKGGFDALIPIRRCDTGKPRKIDEDIMEQIRFLKKEYPRIPATLILQKLLDNGTVNKGDISLSTVNRFVNQLKIENNYTNNKDMRRYERAHINEVWCGDSPAKSLNLGRRVRVQSGLKLDIQGPRTNAAAVHRAQHLNVADRIKSKLARNMLTDEIDYLWHSIFGIVCGYEVEVRFALGLAQIGNSSLIDHVCGGDNPASRGLPEDFDQPHNRHGSRANDVGQHLARPDRR